MSAQSGPPRTAGFQPRRRGGHINPGMRVSDAERNEVSDRLTKHFADGRLDQAEFDERLSRAANAKTQSDFAGLFDDLPDLPGQDTAVPVMNQPSRSPVSRIVFFAFVIAAAVIVGHAVVHSFLPWLLIGLLAFLLLRYDYGRRRRG